jgi:hypothetical protein
LETIQKTDDKALLEEAYRLLTSDTEAIEVYTLNETQQEAIAEARQQVKNGQSLTDWQADKEIDEWLNK